MLRAARELATREKALFMQDLISIAAVPSSNQKYIDSIQQWWERKADMAVPEYSEHPKVQSSGRVLLDWKSASELMLSTLKVKKRLEYGR